MCYAHHKRVAIHGDPQAHIPIKRLGEPQRFLLNALVFEPDECLLWPFARTSAGYAHLWLGGSVVLAHRYVCKRTQGPPPPGKPMALHTCAAGHLGCIAPRHLKWGDHLDNMADKVADGHSRKGENGTATKLTEEDVRAIRSAKGTQREIARRFGVEQTNISAILRRKTWTHLA
jgi:hypothetical protein